VIHFVVGTRAQLLKLASVMRECDRRALQWRWVYTAQHKTTIDEIVAFFDLKTPDYVMGHEGDEARSVERMASWGLTVLREMRRPRTILDHRIGGEHIVLTHGDTFSTVVGALLGRMTRTPVMHVESGLRSFRLFDPFPEEINRLITFSLSDLYACPGERALANLSRYRGRKIDTGANTQIDILDYGLAHLERATLEVPDRPYAVASVHRYENLYSKDRLARVLAAIDEAARRRLVVMPRHPVTESRLERLGLLERLSEHPNVRLMPRLSYQDYLRLLLGAELVMTDGGGNQEELSYLGTPTLLLRGRSERTEGLGENAVLSRLDGRTISEFLDCPERHRRPRQRNRFRPSGVIVDAIEHCGR